MTVWSLIGTKPSSVRLSLTRKEYTVCGIGHENLHSQLANNVRNCLDLSLEFLMGRALDNAMLNVGLKDVAKGMP